MTDSFILGKDAPLESSIDFMQNQLSNIGFHIDERSWLNPIENVWSVHIRDRDCPLLFTNGKGASRKAALASALGEFFERLSTNYFWADYYLGETIANASFVHYPQEKWFNVTEDKQTSDELLDNALWSFYAPDNALTIKGLSDLNSGNTQRGVCTLPFTRQRDASTHWFPVNIIGNLYVSNGMSAGNTETEARVQALSEIFERAVKFRIIAEGLSLPDIPETVINRYPGIRAGIHELQNAGFGILVKDASLGGQYPVACVTLLNPDDQGCYASFGAHPRFEVALERALTELLQGRALDRLNHFPAPGFDQEEIAHPHNMETHFIDSSGLLHWHFLSDQADFEFTDWNLDGSTEDEFNWSCQRIHEAGFDIYIMDYQHLGVYACRILVPGMSEIYPPDDLEWDNNNTGNLFRESILTLPTLSEAQCRELLDTLLEQGLDDLQPVAALIGLAPDPDSIWSALRVGELKTLLGLACDDKTAIREGCQWIALFDEISAERKRVYHCINTLLELDTPSHYQANLTLLYGSKTLTLAQELLNRDTRFFGLNAPGLTLKGCQLHQSLLAAYRKVHPELSEP